MNELAELLGFGSWPEPPDIVPLRILGLDTMPANIDSLQAAFRIKLKQVHPDFAVYESTPLAHAAAAIADQRAEVAELKWARDVLRRKIPPAVTGDGLTGARLISRHEPQRCKGCDGTHRIHGGDVQGFVHSGRWRGYCGTCAHAAELVRQRDQRRQARADRTCACGATFTPARADARYCSAACRQRAHRGRQAVAS